MSEIATEYSLETDTEYLAKLRELVTSGRVRVEFDVTKLRGMDSPVVVVAETERWAMGMVAVCGAIWWFLGIWPAVVAMALCMVAYVAWGRRGIARNIERRIHQKALVDIGLWRRLWQYGGITLEDVDGRTAACPAPSGSWIQFTEAFMRRAAQ